MALFEPSSINQLKSIIGLTGGTASDLTASQYPGASGVRSTLGQIGRGPNIGLPGGGSFGPSTNDPFGETLRTEAPSATLPIYQGEAGRKMGLAGIQAGVGQAQTEEDVTKLRYQQMLEQELSKLMVGLGMSPLRAGGIGPGAVSLASLLGI